MLLPETCCWGITAVSEAQGKALHWLLDEHAELMLMLQAAIMLTPFNKWGSLANLVVSALQGCQCRPPDDWDVVPWEAAQQRTSPKAPEHSWEHACFSNSGQVYTMHKCCACATQC